MSYIHDCVRYIADMLIDLLRSTGRDMLNGVLPVDDADQSGDDPRPTLQSPMLPGADARGCAACPRWDASTLR